MKKKIFAITVSIISLLSPAGWASELKKNELDKVVAFAKTLGVYDCYDFEDAYRHTRMNQVYTRWVSIQSIGLGVVYMRII